MNYDETVDVVKKISAYDPQFPKVSEAIADAWYEHFSQYPALNLDDGLNAVRVYYSTPDRRVPKPADISRIARDRFRDRPETDEERDSRALANDVRLGLDTSWYKTAEQLAAITDVEGRRRAIEQFAKGYGSTATDGETVMSSSSGQGNYAALGLSLRKHSEVSEDEAQPQESPSEPESDDCPHCHFPNGCLVTHACIGMDYRHK